MSSIIRSLTISGLARTAGVGVETVRYYQRRGLMRTPDGAGGVRRYDDQDQRRLGFIRSAQRAGFSLEQIAELLALDASHDHGRALALAQARLADLDEKIASLQAARASLQALATRCQGAQAQSQVRTALCPILASFDVCG